MNAIKRFGSAMIVPVLMFAFFGIVLGFATLFKNPTIMGSLADSHTFWFKFWSIIEAGGWVIFNHMEIVFVVGLPLSLAKKAPGHAALAALMGYLMFNTFINAILTQWPHTFGANLEKGVENVTGLKAIAGIETLDTNILGGIIISAIITWIHNRYYSKRLPEMLGVFQGLTFVVTISFFVMLPVAAITCIVWPTIQSGIESVQHFIIGSGYVGVWLYHFLERVLIPTGLHHFIYAPIEVGPVVAKDGLKAEWFHHLNQFAENSKPLKEQFHYGFMLQGNGKVFGCVGIALAMYFTTPKKNRKKVAALLIPATLTAVVAGITEPLEFTFLFIAPYLFVLHALLAATMDTLMYLFGVVGNMGGGVLDFLATNWIPLGQKHWMTYVVQVVIGLIFVGIYFVLFRYLILKFDIPLPGRRDEEDVKLFSKKDYKDKKGDNTTNSKQTVAGNEYEEKAIYYLDGLGGKENIKDVTNCTTRLRLTVNDPEKVEESGYFTHNQMAHGLVKSGKNVQVVVGMSVPQVREAFENLVTMDDK
ncbi:alpha-glucoside-specific PTS transporter subunit IIBC [Staphylococcus lugdunensis]|jgi:PTS system arbutin-like IIC component|uniref:alpha-glucoside-specific PTS transporter subunit IIBC n=1 Tax=Staphylococcus lugdunensis TaxID=28035 RepID=UPI00045961A1|nr:alpha-glucoside-specific PTS transporter subunit IIBC [Staphylococcus lugdunensis]KAK55885.1 PTS system maltose-specific EIICB component [Staphylococcus lugdunensis VCU150]MCI2845162.1 alpha-glucoside-specific PTS transporter subunit IIBC [Staphylococcus lugdunensis]MDU4768877.1 alpha-glucoside-specific PTS transporter subunit IIBC [Staphylococcus lugdunensis]